MPQSRDDLERQLSQAKERRQALATRLENDGIAEKDLRKQPAWRSLHATCRQLTRRLGAVSAKEKLAVEKAARRSESGDDAE